MGVCKDTTGPMQIMSNVAGTLHHCGFANL
jgi:hypothetical protein